jgi:hypothetical protein
MAGPLDNVRLPQPGDPQISAELIATMVEQIKASLRLEGAGTFRGPYGASIVQRPGPPAPIYARVTAASSTAGFYEWEQVRPNLSDGAWETPSNGLTFENYGEILISGYGDDGLTHEASIGEVYLLQNVIAEDGTTQRLGVALGRNPSFWAKITGNAADGTNKWKYAWTEQQRTAAGWQDLTDGRSGTTTTGFAVNANEANNDGTGIQGNSIDIDGTVFDDNSDLELVAVQGDPVVRMWADIDSSGNTAYSFEYTNAIDGECA